MVDGSVFRFLADTQLEALYEQPFQQNRMRTSGVIGLQRREDGREAGLEGPQPRQRAGVGGLAKRAPSMAAFGRTSFSSTVSLPSSHVTVHLNGTFTPATSR